MDSGENPLPGPKLVTPGVSLNDRRGEESLGKKKGRGGAPFIRALIAFTKAPPSCLNQCPKALSCNPITVGVRISTGEFWEDTSIQILAAGDSILVHPSPRIPAMKLSTACTDYPVFRM